MKFRDKQRTHPPGYRIIKLRAQRRYKRMRAAMIFLAAAILIGGGAAVSVVGFNNSLSFASKMSKSVSRKVRPVASAVGKTVGALFDGKPQAKKGKPVEKKGGTRQKLSGKPTLVIIGLDEKTGRPRARGILVARFDLKGKRIDGIIIPADTFVMLPGQGRQKLSAAYESGLDILLKGVQGIVPATPAGVIETQYSNYEQIAFNRKFERGFEKSTVVNVDPSAVKQLGQFATKLKKEEITLVQLSVNSFVVGGEVIYEPDQQEVARLSKLVWGINQKVLENPRVLVLNGNGRPGIGAEAAALISSAGFDVIETKNADNFNYAKTKIVVYGSGAEGKRIKKALGVGVIEKETADPGSNADYTIILGTDFKLNEQ